MIQGKITYRQLIKSLLWGILLVFVVACNLPSNHDHSATINLIIDDDNSSAASVTGKELLWSKSQIKWKDSTGLISFVAEVKDVDLLVIQTNNTYKSFTCYVEENQELNVVYRHHQYSITGNSLAARQNRLLVQIDQKRNSGKVNDVDTMHEDCAKITHQAVERMINDFIQANEDASPNFIQYARFDNKYFYLSRILGVDSSAPRTYHQYSNAELLVMRNVLDDSDYDLAYLSTYYRILFNNYMDYVRLFGEDYLNEVTANPVLNEWLLAKPLKSEELRQYQMAVSLTKILQIDCNLDLTKAIKDYTGYWSHFLNDQYETVSERGYVRHGIHPDEKYALQLPLRNSSDSLLNLNDLKGNWVYLAIGTNGLGYSPYEAMHLDALNGHIPQLRCLCLSTSEEIYDHKSYDKIQLIYTQPEKLEQAFDTHRLPYSMLINPAGDIVCVNLPKASSGILEPMLRKIVAEN